MEKVLRQLTCYVCRQHSFPAATVTISGTLWPKSTSTLAAKLASTRISSQINVNRTTTARITLRGVNDLPAYRTNSNLQMIFCRPYHTYPKNWPATTYTSCGILTATPCASPGSGTAGCGSLYRGISSGKVNPWKQRNRSVMLYGVAAVVLVIGFSYAAVPLYAVFCQATGLGGQITKGHNIDLVEDMVPVRNRPISIRFNADTAASMQWNFKPQQREIKVVPGETALAFYSARNPMDKPITGISTYNVVPFEAGQYFNKIQCFCFEEQRLNPHEQVDMPVFFYIDPEFAEDPKMSKVDSITLSYTFFEAKEGLVLPDPFTRPAELATS